MADHDVTDEKLDAELRETDARLTMLQSQASARQAKDEMDEISGLRAARDRTQKQFTDLKQKGAASLEREREAIQSALHDLEVEIEVISDRYGAWDAARERRFQARVAEADAQIQMWNAQTDAHQAEGQMQYDAEVAALKQRVDAAKTAFQEWKARQDEKTQQALATASRQFDAAYQSVKRKFSS